jgi:hypothetical protein
MAGATIDHMISLTILIAALLLAMTSFNQMFSSAVAYETNTQVATKAVDIINTLCLSPGAPIDWGATNKSVLGFGLQDPVAGGYSLSPYAMMRLRVDSTDNHLLEYPPDSGNFYNNITANFGNSILTPLGDCINYTTASKLLGINGTYGFSVDIRPLINVNISKVPDFGHLILKIDVSGSGYPLSGANLNYYLFQIDKGEGSTSTIIPYSGVDQTDSSGSVLLEFEDIDDVDDAYQFMVYARLNGLTGVGFYSQDEIGDYPEYVVPLINDYNEGIIMIAHSWGVHEYTETPVPNVNYNATFYVLTPDFQLEQVVVDNSTGQLNYGSKDFETTQIPTSEVGFLFITYRWNNHLGSVTLPWGLGVLGTSTSFSEGFGDSGRNFVATELRTVTIDGLAYNVKVSTWKLGN